MNLKALIKREITINVLVISVIVLGLSAFSYALFFDVDEGGTNVISFGDIDLSFCADSECNSTVANIGNTIGVEDDGNGNMVPVLVYPASDSDGLLTTPFKFTLQNTGDYDLFVDIKLTPDSTFSISSEYPSYSDFTSTARTNVKVAFNQEGLTPTIKKYSTLTNYLVAENIFLEAGSDPVIFELRAWVASDAANTAQGTYFVTNISAIGEFIPEA